jgi:hypothetical protein
MEITNDELALKLKQLVSDVKKDKFGDREHFDSFGFVDEFAAIIKSAAMGIIVSFTYNPKDSKTMPETKPPKSSVNNQNCGNCRFWRQGYQGNDCRRHAPQVMVRQGFDWVAMSKCHQIIHRDIDETVTPKTDADYWCGQWEPKTE